MWSKKESEQTDREYGAAAVDSEKIYANLKWDFGFTYIFVFDILFLILLRQNGETGGTR